jgi:hypothetical protein
MHVHGNGQNTDATEVSVFWLLLFRECQLSGLLSPRRETGSFGS